MRSANLSGIGCRQVDFGGARLTQAIMSKGHFTGSRFVEAELILTDMTRSTFEACDFHSADMQLCVCISVQFHTVDFRYAILNDARFFDSSIQYCNMSFSKVVHADFYRATIGNTIMTGANLRDASFQKAIIMDTNMDDANELYVPTVCPKEGSFIGWKKAITRDGEYVILKLEIPEDALRSSGTGRKCRTNKVKVLEIQKLESEIKTRYKVAYSMFDNRFKYEVGKTVEVPEFCKARFLECAPGLHFFMEREEAVKFAF